MAITFAYRSDQLAPRFVTNPTTAKGYVFSGADTVPSVVASSDTGLIGSTVLDVNKSTGNYRTVRFMGYANWPDMTNGFSLLMRIVPRFTGLPGAANLGGLFTTMGFATQPWGYATMTVGGAVSVRILNPQSSNIINVTSSGTWAGGTAGTCYDFFMSWDGTTDADKVLFYMDNSSIGTATASTTSLYSSANGDLFDSILPCTAQVLGYDGDFDLNEMVVWDSAVNPASVTLTSGSGALNGASRTAFVDVSADDAIADSGGGPIRFGG